MANCDIQSLLSSAACFLCQPPGVQAALELQLLCEILNAGGGGGGSVQLLSTTAADPNVAAIVPANTNAAAEFYQDPSITIFNRWSWSIADQVWVQTVSP